MVTAGGCCTTLATCAVAVCPAGSKKKTADGVDKLSCTSDAASCNTVGGACCESDTATCGGLTSITCAYGFYAENDFFVYSGDKKTPKAVVDAWLSKPATEATKNTACCTAKATCSGSAVA